MLFIFNKEFQISPIYSFKVIRDRSVDVIFDNKQIMGSEDAIQSIRTNILDPKIVPTEMSVISVLEISYFI